MYRAEDLMIQFGVLGAAKITPRALIYPCVDEPGAFIRAIAARDRSRAEEMAQWAHIREVLDDYQAVIEHPKCNAIYIPLPISHHHEWTLKALQAGADSEVTLLRSEFVGAQVQFLDKPDRSTTPMHQSSPCRATNGGRRTFADGDAEMEAAGMPYDVQMMLAIH